MTGPAPPILVTMGDAAGIGPEIACQALAAADAPAAVVVGSAAVMRRAMALGPARRPLAVLDGLHEAAAAPPDSLAVWQPPGLDGDALAALPWGRIDALAGRAAAACIEAAVAEVLAGRARAVVTAPIHKEALAAAGLPWPGHTEMLQSLAAGGGHPAPVRMMLANDELRVVLVTIHQALRAAIDAITFDTVLETLRITHASGARWGVAAPRIAVAGLNPHAGEGGLFGDEELRIIAPAVAAARAQGIDAHGPYPPDTVFMRARRRPGTEPPFDVVVAMTHDHGLIPVKYLGVEQGVNVTLGLPFVRTSPDHGTAFDIAGQGRADPSSLAAALRLADRMAAAVASAAVGGAGQ